MGLTYIDPESARRVFDYLIQRANDRIAVSNGVVTRDVRVDCPRGVGGRRHRRRRRAAVRKRVGPL